MSSPDVSCFRDPEVLFALAEHFHCSTESDADWQLLPLQQSGPRFFFESVGVPLMNIKAVKLLPMNLSQRLSAYIQLLPSPWKGLTKIDFTDSRFLCFRALIMK
ncbi:hypothetical protein XENORESO_009680 [Xenotaenia resolanae]|uniref:Uncharacterized protein n=1 Tax=Xenotaenia resolanae TaxID=208358 RepID=A0ABV0VPZ1_9TELE